jgi:dGTP triphosphohydrolase
VGPEGFPRPPAPVIGPARKKVAPWSLVFAFIRPGTQLLWAGCDKLNMHMQNQSIRERLEEDERRVLSSYAQLSSQTKGRARLEPPDAMRPAYQLDRDRIIHCKAFRRLAGKTQVFLAPEGDHYRTRITHTLEVAQFARSVTKFLGLNEMLTEAIVMGHDLGHTPFGHAGEKVLAHLMPGGFHHVKQSLRVVDYLEHDGAGLNLTSEVRDGILKHSKGKGAIFSDNPNLTATCPRWWPRSSAAPTRRASTRWSRTSSTARASKRSA